MTLRDYIAAAAMQGTLAGPTGGPNTYEGLADAAYSAADAMLAARERKEASNG
jgi:hypothetical protein